MKKDRFQIILQIGLFLLFIFIMLGFAFSYGVCCGDDAIYAKVAKNFANGVRNETIYPLNNWGNFFDPNLGSGPVLLMLPALLIKLVGNTFWAPGFSFILLWTTFLIAIGFSMKRYSENEKNYTTAILIFFLMSYIFMTFHLEQWYALLGEIPAALLIILSIMTYFNHQNKSGNFYSGVFFGLACNTKILVFLPFLCFLFLIIIFYIIDYREKKYRSLKFIITKLFIFLLGFIIPFLIFEVWKFVDLGIQNYVDYWRNYLHILLSLGIQSEPINILNLIFTRSELILERFGLFLPCMFPLLIFGGVILKKEKALFQIYCIFSTIIVINTIYWLLFSIGWARYYIITLIILIFTLSLPFFTRKTWNKNYIFYVTLLLVFSFFSFKHVAYPFISLQTKLFKPSSGLQSLIKIEEQISQKKDEIIVTQNWSTGMDLEYLLDKNVHFLVTKDPNIDLRQPYIFVANKKFLIQPDENLDIILQNCNINDYDQYIFRSCQ